MKFYYCDGTDKGQKWLQYHSNRSISPGAVVHMKVTFSISSDCLMPEYMRWYSWAWSQTGAICYPATDLLTVAANYAPKHEHIDMVKAGIPSGSTLSMSNKSGVQVGQGSVETWCRQSWETELCGDECYLVAKLLWGVWPGKAAHEAEGSPECTSGLSMSLVWLLEMNDYYMRCSADHHTRSGGCVAWNSEVSIVAVTCSPLNSDTVVIRSQTESGFVNKNNMSPVCCSLLRSLLIPPQIKPMMLRC